MSDDQPSNDDQPFNIDNIDDALLFTKVMLQNRFPHIKEQIEEEFTNAERIHYAREEAETNLSLIFNDSDLPF